MKSRRRSTRDHARDEGSTEVDPSFAVGDDELLTPERMTALAKNMVLRKLTRAPQTRQQLADYLLERGITEVVADEVLGRMTEVGLINDVEFAAMFVRSKRASRGLAPRVLAQELRQRGVDADIIEQELAGISPADDRELAETLVARKLTSVARFDVETRTRRLTSMLVRKGFNAGLAYEVVREAIRDVSSDASTS